MLKLREKVIALKISIERNQNELDSMLRFDKSLWFADDLIRLGIKGFILGNIYFALMILLPALFMMSVMLFGWIFGLFTPFPHEYGGAVIPTLMLWQLGKTYFTIKRTNPEIFQRIAHLKKVIAEETSELKKAATALAKSTVEASELERKVVQVMPEYWNNLKGVKLEVAILKLMTDLGYLTNLTKGSGDGGIDVIACKDNKTLLIQCKGWAKPVGSPVIRDMAGVASAHNGKGIVVSPNGFSKEAMLFGKKSGVELWDSNKLSQLAPTASKDTDQPKVQINTMNPFKRMASKRSLDVM